RTIGTWFRKKKDASNSNLPVPLDIAGDRLILRKGVLVTLTLVAVMVGIVLVYEGKTMADVMWLRTHNPTHTSQMVTGSESRRTWMPLENIGPNLERAVIAGEDPSFTSHHGFVLHPVKKRDKTKLDESEHPPKFHDLTQIRSTISQQLARSLFLSS